MSCCIINSICLKQLNLFLQCFLPPAPQNHGAKSNKLVEELPLTSVNVGSDPAGLAHVRFAEQGLADSSDRLMRAFLWPSVCGQGLSFHGQALTDLCHHFNGLCIHYVESEMTTSGCLDMRMINKRRGKAEYWAGKVESMGLLFKEFWTSIGGLWIWWVACALAQTSYTDKCAQGLIPNWGCCQSCTKFSSCSLSRSSLCLMQHGWSRRAQVETPNVRKLGVKSNNWLHAQREGLNKHAPVRGQAICLEI